MPTNPPSPGSVEQPPPAVSRRTIVVGLAVGLPTSATLMAIALRNLDAHALGVSLRSADPKALVLALVAMTLVYVAQAVRWKLIAGVSLPLGRFLAWVVAGVAMNNVVPGRAGDVVRIEWLSRGGRVTRIRSTASIVVDRGCDVLVLAFLLALTYPSMQQTPWLRRLGLGGFGLGLLVAASFVGASLWARRAEVSRRGKARAFADGVVRSIGVGLRPRRAFAIVAISVLAWGAWAVSASLVARSLGIELAWNDAVFVTAVINLGVAIPSSPGFVGTYQWLAVSALGLLGAGHVPAFAFSVLMHALWFVPTTLAGAVLAMRKARLVVAPALPRRTSESHAA
jgi:uncharacterized membrane protein YbhN (UPF0104 family)